MTVAVDNPMPGTWSVHVNEPDEPIGEDRVLWRPPVDGASAGAISSQASNDDGVPYLLVVSTRTGPNPDDTIALTQRSSLPWLAAGQFAVTAALLIGGIGAVGSLVMTAGSGVGGDEARSVDGQGGQVDLASDSGGNRPSSPLCSLG